MPTFRENKKYIREWIQKIDWTQETPLPTALASCSEMEMINALFACLPQGGLITDRAAFILGATVARLYKKNKEQAQVCIRRFMWHMNEESGNIGWGIPQAFGQSLAQSEALAKLYHKILISYVRMLEGDSNFCDHAPLRYSCYEGVYIMGLTRTEYRELICVIIQSSKEDDPACLQMVAKILHDFN